MDMTNFRNSLRSSIAGASLATIVACGGGGGSSPQPVPPVKPSVVILKNNVSMVDTTVQSPGPVTASIDLLVGYSDSSSPSPIIDSVTLVGKSTGQPDITYNITTNGSNVLSLAPTTTASAVSADSTYTFSGAMNVKDVQSGNAIRTTPITATGNVLVKKPLVPSLSYNASVTVVNNDNPGSAVYMSGDKYTMTMTANTNIVNYSNPLAAKITGFLIDINADGTYDQSWAGNGTNNFTQTLDGLVISVPSATTKTLGYRLDFDNPITGSNEQHTGSGQTMSIVPTQNFNYTAAIANPNITANITSIANLLSTDFYNPGDHTNMTVDQWIATLNAVKDGQGVEATSYDTDFIFKAYRLNLTSGTMTVVTDKQSSMYTLQKLITTHN